MASTSHLPRITRADIFNLLGVFLGTGRRLVPVRTARGSASDSGGPVLGSPHACSLGVPCSSDRERGRSACGHDGDPTTQCAGCWNTTHRGRGPVRPRESWKDIRQAGHRGFLGTPGEAERRAFRFYPSSHVINSYYNNSY